MQRYSGESLELFVDRQIADHEQQLAILKQQAEEVRSLTLSLTFTRKEWRALRENARVLCAVDQWNTFQQFSNLVVQIDQELDRVDLEG